MMLATQQRADRLLTVIIPTWNQRDLLRNCLLSLEAQTKTAHILVVDNGSEDGTQEMVARDFPRTEVVSLGANQGFAVAVNRGIEKVRTPYIALLNNDTEADSHWVEAGLAALEERTDFSFFASRMIQFHQREKLDSAGDCYNRRGMPYKRGYGLPIDRFPVAEPVLAACAGAAFYRKEIFEDVGLFDEGFSIYLEDVELSLRSQLAGHQCLFIPDAIVFHHEAASDPDLPQARSKPVVSGTAPPYYSPSRVYWITRNRWQLMLLYQPWVNLHCVALGWVKSLFFHLLKAGQTWAFVKGLFNGVRLSPKTLRRRRQLNSKWAHNRKELCRRFHEC